MTVFEALADPTRREIVSLLAAGDRSAGQIAGRFDVSRPAISRHLRVLRESGVASSREVAQRRIYRLNPQALQEAETWLARNRRFWLERLDALEAQLDQLDEKEHGT